MLFSSTNVITAPFPDVYLGLNGIIIPNHGYVPISSIPLNSTGDTALLCHTNRLQDHDTNKHSGGDWYSPIGTRVSSTDVPGFVRSRGPMVVRLKRTNSAAPEGIYWCSIQDDLLTLWRMYVGLYNDGKGILLAQTIKKE